jgi:hypothetical protein
MRAFILDAPMTDPIEILRAKINAETGQLGWKELERHFARGVVIKVQRGLDLVDVAARIAQDDKSVVERWLNEGRIARASAEDAADWNERQPMFWAVVTAPWVLVQEVGSALNS